MQITTLLLLAVATSGVGCQPNTKPADRPSKAEAAARVALPKGIEGGKVDSFGLPLEIDIKAPDPPPEIVGPSPPIEEKK